MMYFFSLTTNSIPSNFREWPNQCYSGRVHISHTELHCHGSTTTVCWLVQWLHQAIDWWLNHNHKHSRPNSIIIHRSVQRCLLADVFKNRWNWPSFIRVCCVNHKTCDKAISHCHGQSYCSRWEVWINKSALLLTLPLSDFLISFYTQITQVLKELFGALWKKTTIKVTSKPSA